MFIKVRNYLPPNFTIEDVRVQVRSPPINYVYGCNMTQVTRGALGYVSYQKGTIEWYRTPCSQVCNKESPRPVLQDPVSDGTFTRCKHQTVFLYYMSVKYHLRGYFRCFGVHVTHWLLCQTDEINTIFQPFIEYTYEGIGEF